MAKTPKHVEKESFEIINDLSNGFKSGKLTKTDLLEAKKDFTNIGIQLSNSVNQYSKLYEEMPKSKKADKVYEGICQLVDKTVISKNVIQHIEKLLGE